MNRFALPLALLPLALLTSLSACGGEAARSDAQPPLAGARIGGPFTLTDQNGRQVSERDFAGRYRIMYFGYTYCPDVCPVDMQVTSAALKQLDRTAPAVAKRIVPVFVSVDPERDRPPVLKAFAAAFDPRIVALTGTPAQIAALAKAYGVYVARQPPAAGGGYMVDHSRVSYLMGPDGKPIALLPTEEGADKVAAELTRWVH